MSYIHTIISSFGYNTSNVDWCEPNYEVTIYVVEFFNTVSNLIHEFESDTSFI